MGIRSLDPPLRKAVFLDRDGVLNRALVRGGKPYPPSTLAEFEILPEAFEAVSLLRRCGFWLCVVTNQPDVARGTQELSVVESMHATLLQALPLDGVHVCYHDDADRCGCRKPNPGMLLTAAAKHRISLPDSYMIGDRWRDIDCGHAANCTTIFIDRGYEESLRKRPHFQVPDVLAAAHVICSIQGGQITL